MAISCSLPLWAAGSSTFERFGGVAGLSVETYRVAALVEAGESVVAFVSASQLSGYKRYLFLTRRSSRHILLWRLRFKVIRLLVQQRVCCCANR